MDIDRDPLKRKGKVSVRGKKYKEIVINFLYLVTIWKCAEINNELLELLVNKAGNVMP